MRAHQMRLRQCRKYGEFQKLQVSLPRHLTLHAMCKLMGRVGLYGGILLGCANLSACSSAAMATGKIAEIALNAVGVKLPANVEQAEPSKTITLHIMGTADLNAGTDGQALSTVIRIYKLRDQTGFLTLPYKEFGTTATEKSSLGNDLVEVKELILSPNQIFDLKEKVNGDVSYLGVAALFRSPDSHRWRFAFPLAQVDRDTIAIGVHACTMTASVVSTEIVQNEYAHYSQDDCK